MSLLVAASAILLTAPQSPPKGNVGAPPSGNIGSVPRGNIGVPAGGVGAVAGGNIGSVPGGNVGSIPGGNAGGPPRGNIGNVPGGNVGTPRDNLGKVPNGNVGVQPKGDMSKVSAGNVDRAKKGNVKAAPKGNVKDYPKGNVHIYSRGNVDKYLGGDVDPRAPKRPRWGFELPSRWGDDPVKMVVVDPAPREESKNLNFVAPKPDQELIDDLETVRLTLNSIDHPYNGRRAIAALQVTNAIEVARTGRTDPKAVATVAYGSGFEGRMSADCKMLAARAKLTSIFARLRADEESENEAVMRAVKRSLDSIDAALAIPWRNSDR